MVRGEGEAGDAVFLRDVANVAVTFQLFPSTFKRRPPGTGGKAHLLVVTGSRTSASRKPDRVGERPEAARKRQPSDHDPLDLIEAEFIAPAIVELRRAR
jgi:hypothetical protein